jgi:5-carboxymethyl-2-hydroxymuconate isomerase
MPHLVILYSANLEPRTDMTALARTLADTMIAQRDDAGAPVFPVGGTRVFAYPAAHFAVADGSGDFGFIYLNVRMAKGRSASVQQRIGEALAAATRTHCATLLASHRVGITFQIDVGAEVFDAKIGNLHPLFATTVAPKKD